MDYRELAVSMARAQAGQYLPPRHVHKFNYFRLGPPARNVYAVSLNGEVIAEFVDVAEYDACEEAELLRNKLEQAS